ncbi:hypothetical protein CMV37_26990, partial [Bacillus cereus]
RFKDIPPRFRYIFEKEIPHIYKDGILNDKTIGVDTVKEFKKHSLEIEKQKGDGCGSKDKRKKTWREKSNL